jgi:AraC-like DNA-binding protein
MQLTHYLPEPPLSQFVESIWAVNGGPNHAREIVLPNGATELIINFGSYHKVVDKNDHDRFQVYRESWIAGLQKDYLMIEAFHESNLMGIRFRPGGAYPFLQFPLSELTNEVIECDLVFGGLISELRDRLFEARGHSERIRLVEEMLCKRINMMMSDPLVNHILKEIRIAEGQKPIAELSRQIGISNKQLISRFKKTVGISPKFLARILRFQSVIRLANGRTAVNLTEIAHRCGYYDQAHMIREFRLLSGATPTDYLKHRDEDENHILLT